MAPATGLTHLVVFAPKRRLDLAFPDRLPLAHLLPSVLRHAGDDLAEAGRAHEGWVLRRADGSVLDAGRSLAAQRVHDGETLHLAPRRTDWPEIAYDDIVDAIASGSRRRGRQWSRGDTTVAGFAIGAVAMSAGLAALAVSGPPWRATAMAALVVAGFLVLAGTVLSRALGEAPAGAAAAAGAMPFAFLGGLVLFADEPLSRLGAPHVVTAAALLVIAAVAGHVGTAEHGRLFVAGVAAGGGGMLAGTTALGWPDGPGAAALVAALVLLPGPVLPAVAVRIGQIPLPELPRAPEDLVRDDPLPDRHSVEAATARADETLTGLLFGVAVSAAVSAAVLVGSGRATALALVAVVSVAHLLRARFHAAVRHRVPLLVAGTSGLALLAAVPVLASGADRALLVFAVSLATAVLAVTAGLVYRRRHPSPRLGRLAEVLDVLLTLAVVPLAADVFGLLGLMRGLGG